MNTAHDEVHIASFVVQHRAEAAATLQAHIEAAGDLELAIPGESRSVVLCECADQYAIMQSIDALRALPGVLNVSLVYHHAEPRESLDATVSPVSGSGVVP